MCTSWRPTLRPLEWGSRASLHSRRRFAMPSSKRPESASASCPSGARSWSRKPLFRIVPVASAYFEAAGTADRHLDRPPCWIFGSWRLEGQQVAVRQVLGDFVEHTADLAGFLDRKRFAAGGLGNSRQLLQQIGMPDRLPLGDRVNGYPVRFGP